MGPNKSLDECELIAALLYDAHASYQTVFNTRCLRLTLKKLYARYRLEGHGFLTKTLPRLGKHFDQVLAGTCQWNSTDLGFKSQVNSKLPKFLGELFQLVLTTDGLVLPDPDASCVRIIRQILYSYSKYKLPYSDEDKHKVLDAFVKAEEDLRYMSSWYAFLHAGVDASYGHRRPRVDRADLYKDPALSPLVGPVAIARAARTLLAKLFWRFDPTDIVPRHGPGVVSTKEKLWRKFEWTNISERIATLYPIDAYFCASTGHVCDVYNSFSGITAKESSAQVILVPKDSRGPRLISCEPVDNQWIQQGLRQTVYHRVETHRLTKHNVFFTNQRPNQIGALLGSSSGKYATLDLKEASDRVHLELVRLLFPPEICKYFECCRSSSTVLPDGTQVKLHKFAPMGSALCFPVLALTIWSLLTAGAPNADTRESILVYGDDVIVPTAYAESAITILESFGLLVNRSKSCFHGLFRESCGTDAFSGTDVTPVRFRTVWKESLAPEVYESWIAYANQLYDRRCYTAYEYIVARLDAMYGPIPGEDMKISCPSLRVSTAVPADFRKRHNKHLQKVEYRVRVSESKSVFHHDVGWNGLLRYFTEGGRSRPASMTSTEGTIPSYEGIEPFSVSKYTNRHSSMLKWRWR